MSSFLLMFVSVISKKDNSFTPVIQTVTIEINYF